MKLRFSPRFLITMLCTALLSAAASAQTVAADSTATKSFSEPGEGIATERPKPPEAAAGSIGNSAPENDSTILRNAPLSVHQLPLNLTQNYPAALLPFTASIPTDGRIFLWNNGGVFGDVSSTSMPGMMGVESGRLTLVQQAGRFTFAAYGEAVKYGYYGGLQTSLGFGGSVGYRISDRVSVTLFGSYYTRLNAGMTPGMMGYTAIPNFGGYVDYRFADRWGVKVGAQAYRSDVTNRIEAQPMVIPYYKLSKNAEIGVDVGGILYQIIRSNSSHGQRMNPTIAPPRPGPPPVR